VIVISENLATEYWGTAATALGKRMRLPALEGLTEEQLRRQVVGVVGNVHDDGVARIHPPWFSGRWR